MKKRLLSIILALAMCLGLLPATALAATNEDDYWTDVLIPWNQTLDGDVLDSRGTLTSAAYVSDNGIYEIWAGGNVLQLQAYKETSDMSVVHFAFHEVTTTNTTTTEAVRFRLHVVDETHITMQCIGNAAPYYNQTLYILPQYNQPIEGKYLGWNSLTDVFLSDEPVLIELKDKDLKCVSTGSRLFYMGDPLFRKMQETLSVKKVQTFTYDGTVKLPVITGTNNNPQRTSEVNYGLDGVDTWYTKYKATEDAGFRKDVGSYTAYIRVKRQKVTSSGVSGQDTFVFGPIKVNIVAQAQITRDAAAIAGLTYNGKTQELVSPADGTGGTVKYSMDNANWSTDIPTAKDAGTYTVYYKVFGEAFNDGTSAVPISDSITKSVSVTIAQQALKLNSDEVKQDIVKYFTGRKLSPPCMKKGEYGTTSKIIPADAITYGGNYLESAVGEYTATVQPSSNYTWKDGSTNSVSLNWKIISRTINLTGVTAQSRPYEAGNLNVNVEWDGSAKPINIDDDAQNALNEALRDGKFTITVDPIGVMEDDAVGANKRVRVKATMTGTNEEYLNGFRLNYIGGSDHQLWVFNCVDITKPEYTLIAPTAAEGLTYDGTEKALLTAPASSQEEKNGATGITYSYRLGTDGTWSSSIPTASAAGTYDVYYRANETTNYVETVCKTPVQVTIKPCEIALPTDDDLEAATYDGSEQTASLKESYADRDKVKFTAGQVQTNADTYSVTLQLKDSNYTWPNAQTTRTLNWTIAPKTIGIDWGSATFTYNGSKQCPTATATGLVGEDTCTITVAGGQTNAGNNYTATATGVGNSNYQLPIEDSAKQMGFSISPATITGVTLTSASAVYTGSSQSPVISAVQAGTLTLNDTDYTVSYKNSSDESVTDLTNVGDYKVVVTAKENSNFTGSAKADFQITKAETNSWDSAPSVMGWTYGDENPTLPSAAAKFGTVTVEYRLASGTDEQYSTTVPTNAGSYRVRFTVDGTDNYAGLSVEKDLTIGKKTIGIQWGSAAFTYNGSEQCPTATATGLVENDTCSITVTGEQTNAGDNYTATADRLDNGNYQLPTSGTTKDFTISPKVLTKNDLEKTGGSITKTYDGNTTADGITVGVKSTSLMRDSDVVTVTGSAAYNSANVSEANQIVFTPDAITTGNYTLASTETLTIPGASITKKDVSISAANVDDKPYDGSADATVTAVTFDGAVDTLTKGTDYEVTSAAFPDADADAGNVDVTINVALKGTAAGNYNLTNGTGYVATSAAKINKIDWSSKTAAGSAMYGNPGTVDLSDCLAPGGSFGTVAKSDTNSVLSGNPAMEGNSLEFAFADVRGNIGKTAEITVPVTGATNYNNYSITVTVTVEAKTEPTVTAPTAVDGLIYNGEAQTLIGAGSTTEGTTLLYSLDGTDYSTDLPSAVNAGDYTVYYKVKGNSTYADVDAKSLTVTIGKKEVTAAPKDVTITRGSAIPDFELTYTGLLGEDTLTPSAAPTFTCYEKDGTTAVSTRTATGSYTITWTNTNVFDGETNYQVVAATGTLTINNPSHVVPTYPPVMEQPDEGGNVTVSPKNPTVGSKVTVTPDPDADYEVDKVIVTDQNGNPVKVTDNGDGTYSFTQPIGKVMVKVTFTDKTKSFFVDVPADAYYYDAVLWAAKNGITGGVDATHFAPNAPCTRAQAVTFLWRAAGCPAPKNSEMPFTDVKTGDYYYNAVLWAVENGITNGTGDTTFSSDAVCTRGQIVTFLWRSQNSSAADSVNSFADVKADAYYAPAVAWAAANGVTGGTGDDKFSPDADCTRAQIVTFLYRCLGDE